MPNSIESQIQEIVENEKYISCSVFRLTSEGKKTVSAIIEGVLKKYGIERLSEEIFAIVMELAFNAIKANYNFIMVMEEYMKKVEKDDFKDVLKYLVRNQQKFEDVYSARKKEELKNSVREILKLEKKGSQILSRANEEKRALSPEEEETVKRCFYFSNHAQKRGIKVNLGISFDSDLMIFEVINDAPITYKALEKIYGKRMMFKSYLDSGKEEMFYIENLDSSESAGFGAAMVDSRLYKFGLDPFTSFEVVRLGPKTAVTISLPVSKLRSA